MQVVILAGGMGTRMGEETYRIPKPMIKIGELPILYHIMKYYSYYGHIEFLILGGYKYEVIEEYCNGLGNNWKTKVIDTGLETLTGSRILKAYDHIKFPTMLTYGDGLSNIDLNALWMHHTLAKKRVTISGVHPPGRFGTLKIENGEIVDFNEKKRLESEWVNGGFMVLEESTYKYIKPNEMLEFKTLPRLLEFNELNVYLHEGWWYPMDTQRDKTELETLWRETFCPWRKDE